jgi:hypothetical protein
MVDDLAFSLNVSATEDEVAEVTVYTIKSNDVTSNKYVVVRISGIFNFKKLV